MEKKKSRRTDGHVHQIEGEFAQPGLQCNQSQYVEDDAYHVVDTCYTGMDACFTEMQVNSIESDPSQVSRYLDSGASNHITGNKSVFSTFKPSQGHRVKSAVGKATK